MNPDPTYPRHGGNPESNLAFEKSREFHEADRNKIYSMIACAPYGMNSHEIEKRLGKSKNCFSGRLTELKEAKLIIQCGRRDGAAIYVSTKPARLF